MHRDDLLSQIRIRARLYGRNHARRVVQAVMHALQRLLPDQAYYDLARQLPADVGVTSSGNRHLSHSHIVETRAARQLIRDVADELHVTGPDAAFYTRITLEQLNAFCRGVTPAQLAPSLPADVRPLLSARTDDATNRRRQTRMIGSTPPEPSQSKVTSVGRSTVPDEAWVTSATSDRAQPHRQREEER